MKNIVFISIVLLLGGMLFAGVADFTEKETVVIVNSQDYWDVIGGAVYAVQNGYPYAFILTSPHGQYWLDIIANSEDNILYYESENPVYEEMGEDVEALPKININVMRSDSLEDYFASSATGNYAIIVTKTKGAEAVSAAPYAALTHSGLYFTEEQDVNSAASNLRKKGKVIVYGSIANSLSDENKEKVQIINTGSIYLDNAEILSMYSDISTPEQALFASGKTFEASMVSNEYPIALLGRTEASEELIEWIRTSTVKRGIVLDGDAEIGGAIESIKKETGIPIYAVLGEGFPGDSKMHPLAVMQLSTPNTMLEVGDVKYAVDTKGFEIEITNKGEWDAYVRAAAGVDGGKMGSSKMELLAPGQTKVVFIPLDAGFLVKGGYISEALFHIYSGSDPYVTESIDAISYKQIKSETSTPPASPLSIFSNYTITPAVAKDYAQETGAKIFSFVVALLLMLVAAYLFIHREKPGGHVVLGARRRSGRAHKRRRKR
ncbi:MAG: hypothetical protein ABIH83_02870 [Candidatus Micrarchaeota archaeon]